MGREQTRDVRLAIRETLWGSTLRQIFSVSSLAPVVAIPLTGIVFGRDAMMGALDEFLIAFFALVLCWIGALAVRLWNQPVRELERERASSEASEAANAQQVAALKERARRAERALVSRLAVAKSRLRHWAHEFDHVSILSSAASGETQEAFVRVCRQDIETILGPHHADKFDSAKPRLQFLPITEKLRDGTERDRVVVASVPIEWQKAARWLSELSDRITESDLLPGFDGRLHEPPAARADLPERTP